MIEWKPSPIAVKLARMSLAQHMGMVWKLVLAAVMLNMASCSDDEITANQFAILNNTLIVVTQSHK